MKTNLIDPHDVLTLTPEDIHERVIGSKLIVGVEATMNMVQWGTKACLLFLYHRITENLAQNRFVKIVGAYVAATYIVMEILYLGYWCRPFSAYWQTPTTNIQCPTAIHHLIMNLAFNLSSDLLIMSIPLPLLIRAHLEVKRKIVVCLPFTLGVFSIICAILSKHVSFTHPFSPEWVYWYTREASCVMIVANMPYIWGLARRFFKVESFWGRGSNLTRVRDVNGDGTDDTGVEVVSIEVRGIHGHRPAPDILVINGEKQSGTSSWRRLSNIFKDGETIGHPSPAIIIETKDVSITSSAADSNPDSSVHDEAWKNIDWSKRSGKPQMSRVSNSQSAVVPRSPASPSVAVLGSQRASTTENRRSSIFTLRRHTSTPRSEISRQNTRTFANLNVDAIDRLYRLDDEDLIADVEAAKSHSRGGTFD